MNRIIFVLASVSVGLALFFLTYKVADGAEQKNVVLATVDIDKNYEILGVVSYRSSETMPDRINNALTKQAEELGADYVVGITYYSGFGYLYGSGTAVKLIKKDR